MSDLTPPPERRLDDLTRQRMRADLIAATAQPTPRSSRSWLVPAAAAAAVAAVIAGGALMLNNDEGTSTLSPGASDTSGSTAANSPTMEAATPDPACVKAVKEFLPAAEMKYSGSSAVSNTEGREFESDLEIWVDGDRWQVCDTFATLDDPAGQKTPTLLAVHQGRTVPNKEQLRISMNFVEVNGALQSQYIAAGRVSAAVTKIRYTFPDGRVEDLRIARDGYWSLAYFPSSGALAEGDLRGVDPIEVTVTADGGTHSYTLEWGVDTCAQINHGC